jgi:hypothetical protein
MNNDWRSRNKMTPRQGLKVALAILGLMAGCILVLWALGRFMRP